MADIELGDLEVPSWPVEAYPFEPVHSLFARFAERNGQTSTAVFARHVGINWTHPNLSELLHFCARYPVRHLERTIAATPVQQSKRVLINGQVFNPNTDWSIYQPRVCEGCLYEASYYRNWWDITVIHHCPIHDLPLIARKRKAKLTLWYSSVGETPDGGRFARFAPRVELSTHRWEHYLLGRMGVVNAAPNSTVDNVDLYHIIEAAELLGTIAGGAAESPIRYRLQALSRARADVLAGGAPVLLAGSQAIYECVLAHILAKQKALNHAGVRPTHGALFGGRLLKLGQQSSNPLFAVIRKELDKVIDETKVYIRRVKVSDALATKTERISFEQLSAETGLRKHQLRQLAFALNMLPDQWSHGAYIPLSGRDMAMLRTIARGLLNTPQAAEYLGLSVRDLNWLHSQNILLPSIKSRHRLYDLYRKQDLDALLHSVRATLRGDFDAQETVSLYDYGKLSGLSLRDVLSGLLTGMLKAVAWDESQSSLRGCVLPKPAIKSRFRAFRPRTTSKKPGLNKADAAATLGVAPSVTKELLAAGYLRLMKQAGTSRPRVDEESVRQFSEKYAPAHLYAEVLQCRPSAAYGILSQYGVAKLPNINARDASFVERQMVRAVLGLAHDPEALVSDVSGLFWKEFSHYVSRSGSSTRMFGKPKLGKVRLYSGDRALSLVLQINSQKQLIGYELICDATESSRRYDRICNRLRELTDWLGDGAVDMKQQGRIAVSEAFPCNLGCQDYWPDVFRWIEQRMEYFRSIFSCKNPPKSANVEGIKSFPARGSRVAPPLAELC